MRSRDLARLVALLCVLLSVGCSNEQSGAVSTQVNLDVVHPNAAAGSLGFTIDRVDYRVTCEGTTPGDFPIPPADTTGADYGYDDTVDISGAFEIVDTRIPPVWQATMGLPPGECTMTMSVYDEDEVVCIGWRTLTIVDDGTPQKFDITLVCSLSVDLPSGGLNADVSFEFVVGNLCPRLYSFMAIPSTVDISAIPPRTRVEYRTIDPDATCGNNCRPEVCTADQPPVCTPSPYNPADPRCNPTLGGDPASVACQDGTASGLVCTMTATPTATAVPGGNFVSQIDGATLVGPTVAVNLDDYALDGTGVAVPGADVFYECDSAIPGSVNIDIVCTDGDFYCDRVETMTVICPGQNFCDSDPVDCSAPNDCTADGLCDAFCNPANLAACSSPGNRCPGQGDPLASGTVCTSGGGNVCDGAGACVECVDDSLCDSSPLDCREPAQCVGNACQPRALSPVGTPCSNGECDAAGDCQFVAIDPPSSTKAITLGCTNSVSSDVSILSFDLTVDPTAVVSGQALTADLDGVAEFSESFLDAAQAAIPGGVTKAAIIDLQATVIARSGGTGADVALTTEAIAYTCAADAAACDPLNDAASIPGARENSDCLPLGSFNPCARHVPVPTSSDCAPGGVCDGLGKLAAQCDTNGFCVTGGIPLPLEAAVGSYTANASGTLRFGWDDASTGATVDTDGTWLLPPVLFADPLGPNGLRVNASGLAVGLECTMGVDSDDPVSRCRGGRQGESHTRYIADRAPDSGALARRKGRFAPALRARRLRFIWPSPLIYTIIGEPVLKFPATKECAVLARLSSLLLVTALLALPTAADAQDDYVLFESGHVRPMAMSPDGVWLYVANTPDAHVEAYVLSGSGATHVYTIPVGLEPVAVAAPSNDRLWVVNHLSDSVSIIDTSLAPPRVVRTLHVGDEPRDIVFASGKAFITTAHRGQNTDVAGRGLRHPQRRARRRMGLRRRQPRSGHGRHPAHGDQPSR